jgi:hypothetical protein
MDRDPLEDHESTLHVQTERERRAAAVGRVSQAALQLDEGPSENTTVRPPKDWTSTAR